MLFVSISSFLACPIQVVYLSSWNLTLVGCVPRRSLTMPPLRLRKTTAGLVMCHLPPARPPTGPPLSPLSRGASSATTPPRHTSVPCIPRSTRCRTPSTPRRLRAILSMSQSASTPRPLLRTRTARPQAPAPTPPAMALLAPRTTTSLTTSRYVSAHAATFSWHTNVSSSAAPWPRQPSTSACNSYARSTRS